MSYAEETQAGCLLALASAAQIQTHTHEYNHAVLFTGLLLNTIPHKTNYVCNYTTLWDESCTHVVNWTKALSIHLYLVWKGDTNWAEGLEILFNSTRWAYNKHHENVHEWQVLWADTINLFTLSGIHKSTYFKSTLNIAIRLFYRIYLAKHVTTLQI